MAPKRPNKNNDKEEEHNKSTRNHEEEKDEEQSHNSERSSGRSSNSKIIGKRPLLSKDADKSIDVHKHKLFLFDIFS